MSKFETAVKVVADDLRNTLETDYRDWDINSWSEMLEAFGLDSSEMKDEIRYTLNQYGNENNINLILNDELEIEDNDGKVYTYRQLTNKVRKQLF